MKAVFHKLTQEFASVFEHKCTGNEAIGFSILLHITILSAVASFHNRTDFEPTSPKENPLVFEFTPELVEISSSTSASDLSGVRNETAEKLVGRASNNLKGNMNRESYLMASLASLKALETPFAVDLQEIDPDSAGGFSPIFEGKVPGSIYDSVGRKKGEGKGSGNGIKVYIGSGGGSCPSGGPTIFQ